tara:strand:+ start:180 stop:647 length:468 start_codon:yes stop_codon:yes gene_type:complete
MITIDNFLDKDLLKFISYKFLHDTPHWFDHFSEDPKDGIFYASTIAKDNPLVQFVFFKIKQEFKIKNTLKRSYINIQHRGMNGSFHKDDGEFTYMLMVSETLKPGEGTFEIKNGPKIDFVQNRLIMFEANKLHKGNAPLNEKPRCTWVFKTNENN